MQRWPIVIFRLALSHGTADEWRRWGTCPRVLPRKCLRLPAETVQRDDDQRRPLAVPVVGTPGRIAVEETALVRLAPTARSGRDDLRSVAPISEKRLKHRRDTNRRNPTKSGRLPFTVKKAT